MIQILKNKIKILFLDFLKNLILFKIIFSFVITAITLNIHLNIFILDHLFNYKYIFFFISTLSCIILLLSVEAIFKYSGIKILFYILFIVVMFLISRSLQNTILYFVNYFFELNIDVSTLQSCLMILIVNIFLYKLRTNIKIFFFIQHNYMISSGKSMNFIKCVSLVQAFKKDGLIVPNLLADLQNKSYNYENIISRQLENKVKLLDQSKIWQKIDSDLHNTIFIQAWNAQDKLNDSNFYTNFRSHLIKNKDQWKVLHKDLEVSWNISKFNSKNPNWAINSREAFWYPTIHSYFAKKYGVDIIQVKGAKAKGGDTPDYEILNPMAIELKALPLYGYLDLKTRTTANITSNNQVERKVEDKNYEAIQDFRWSLEQIVKHHNEHKFYVEEGTLFLCSKRHELFRVCSVSPTLKFEDSSGILVELFI